MHEKEVCTGSVQTRKKNRTALSMLARDLHCKHKQFALLWSTVAWIYSCPHKPHCLKNCKRVLALPWGRRGASLFFSAWKWKARGWPVIWQKARRKIKWVPTDCRALVQNQPWKCQQRDLDDDNLHRGDGDKSGRTRTQKLKDLHGEVHYCVEHVTFEDIEVWRHFSVGNEGNH